MNGWLLMITDICSDKTGTLTQGKMVGKEAWLASYGTLLIESFDEPYNPDVGIIKYVAENSHQSETSKCESSEKIPNHPALNHFLQIAALANHATLTKVDSKESTGELFWKAKGDPTEIAILVFASRFGLEDNLPLPKLEWSEIQEFPFESAIKIMSVICRRGDTHESRLFTKGAVEKVMRRCSLISGLQSEDPRPLNDEDSLNILANMKRLAQKGLRVLAVADKPVQFTMGEDLKQPKFSRDKMECELTFRGLIGIYDPPRPESKPSVLKCHQAGIQVHMLTGDHIDTARTIATEVGILPRRIELLRADIAKAAVMTAQEFDKLSEEEMNSLPELPLVVARCTPSTKVHMIKTLHRRGKFVAMTGDGVNDAPSLRHADIGIAMGVNGSEVAKSVSDIILQDDNFASILNAVEEGRRIFDNVQKFMIHVLAANVGLVITLLVGLAFRDPDDKSLYPLSPVEILFMLLVAGAFTENGLGFEAASPDILRRPPQNVSNIHSIHSL
jgi:potassium/sodium efflux P-type ATPase